MAANSSHGLDDFVDLEPETPSEKRLTSTKKEESNGDDIQAEVSINIDDTVNHINRRLSAYPQVYTGFRLICRVPNKFRSVNSEAYDPISWSFGPYHHGNERLLHTEKQKPFFLTYMLNSYSAQLGSYIEGIKSMESEARNYYSEIIQLDDIRFREMLLLDSCCLLSLIPREHENPPPPQPNSRQGQIQPQPRLTFQLEILHDLILLENQIPFFVLQNVYNVANGENGSASTEQLKSKFIKWLKRLMYPKLPGAIIEQHTINPIHHILHLLHSLVRPTPTLETAVHNKNRKCKNRECEDPKCKKPECEKPRRWRRAIEYVEAGVSFKRRKPKRGEHSLLDIEFRHGTLFIPLLEINNLTEAIFRNLVALEIETAQHGYDVTSYMLFMSDLLSMLEDVTFLSRKNIIIHNMGSDEEVSQLFKVIRMHAPSNMILGWPMRNLYCQLEKHHGSQWKRWVAWLKHRHFSNPWLVIALLAAVVILVFTVLQGVFAAVSYKPN